MTRQPKEKPVPKQQPVVLPPLTWHQSPNYSSRHGEKVHLIVCHRPVGSYAGSIATLCDPSRQASAHVITKTGGLEATQLVAWGDKAWACVAFNSMSDNIEFSDEMWVGQDPHGLAVAARIVAFRCHERGIPPVWTRDPLNTAGVCRHYDLGVAGGGHTDPTTDDSVWRSFMSMVIAEFNRGGFRATWGR
jgi:hypothetical protein